jgi:hypothetical protein
MVVRSGNEAGPTGEEVMKREEKPTSATPGQRSGTPTISHGNWEPTCYLKYTHNVLDGRTLMQKFRRRVKRDWGHGTISRCYEYEWMPVPHE